MTPVNSPSAQGLSESTSVTPYIGLAESISQRKAPTPGYANILQCCRVVAILVSVHKSVYSKQRFDCCEHLNNSTPEFGNLLGGIGVQILARAVLTACVIKLIC